MTKNARVYLEDILESIEKIEEYVKGLKWRDFDDAVRRRISELER